MIVLFFATSALFTLGYHLVSVTWTSFADLSIYQRYAELMLANPDRLPREYPPASMLILIVPELLAPHHYFGTFVLIAACAGAASVLLVDRLSGHGGFYLVLLFLGAWGTLFTRYDIFVVLLTLYAFLLARRSRWILAQACLVVGVTLKLYPLILMPLIVLWEFRATRGWPWKSSVGGACLLALAAATSYYIAADTLPIMLRYHANRPLEFGSTGATIAWMSRPISTISFAYGSYNINSSPPVLIMLSTVATITLPLLVYVAFFLGMLKPAGAWGFTLIGSIAVAKVFSPQYIMWALPFAVLADAEVQGNPFVSRDYSRALWIAICVSSSLVYPLAVEHLFPPGVVFSRNALNATMLLIAVRNGLWVTAVLAAAIRWFLPVQRPFGLSLAHSTG